VSSRLARDFPLFPLELVVLPTEAVPLHIFEERYKTMIGECLAADSEFGIVWLADDGLREIGCTCRVERVLEQSDDGRINLLARGVRPLRIIERQSHLPYPAGVVEFLEDQPEQVDAALRIDAQTVYRELLSAVTDRELSDGVLQAMDAYELAGTIEFGLEAKQGLLELRSENARLRLVTRLIRAASKRLEFVGRAQARARSNGIVRFS
jgi:ATP-dependent Lon protease